MAKNSFVGPSVHKYDCIDYFHVDPHFGGDEALAALSKELHEKHRQRMKQSFRDAGLQGFQPHNIVEMMLFYSLPRCNTNETAHLLLNEFGSIAGILDAPFEALTNVYGVGTESATFIKFLPELFRAYEESKFAEKPCLDTSETAKKYLSKIGYENMRESYYFAEDGICTVNFAATQDDVILYPDLIKVSVNLSNGEIMSFDATGYVYNHQKREILNATINRAQAEATLNGYLEIIDTRLCKISDIYLFCFQSLK